MALAQFNALRLNDTQKRRGLTKRFRQSSSFLLSTNGNCRVRKIFLDGLYSM